MTTAVRVRSRTKEVGRAISSAGAGIVAAKFEQPQHSSVFHRLSFRLVCCDARAVPLEDANETNHLMRIYSPGTCGNSRFTGTWPPR